MKRFLISYWFPMTAGLTITGASVLSLVNVRGGFAIGGEFMITPALMIIHFFIRDTLKRKERKNRAVRRNQRRTQQTGLRVER